MDMLPRDTVPKFRIELKVSWPVLTLVPPPALLLPLLLFPRPQCRWTPLPPRGTRIVAPSSVVTSRVPEAAPAAAGRNVTVTVTLCPGAIAMGSGGADAENCPLDVEISTIV